MGTTDSDKPDLEKFKEFMEKIQNDKTLPQNMNKVLLERYLRISFNDVEAAFGLLKTGLEMRAKASYLFTDRDLMSNEIQTALNCFQFVPLPKITKEKYKVTVIRFHKCDASLYDSVYVIKAALMMFDACYTMYDNGDDAFVAGEIFILDVEGFSFRQFLDLSKNVKTFLFYTNFLQEGAPVTLIHNHVANTSSVLDGVMTLVKPILSKKITELVTFSRYSTALTDYIDKEVLPSDYGGDEKCLYDLYQDWLKVLNTKSDYLKDDSHWKLNE